MSGRDEAGTDPRQEERALVEQMLDGDEQAMESFADIYFPALYRFARSRLGGDAELARDIVQTTVCKALTKLRSFRGEAPLLTWLCACCRNEMAMYFRRKKISPTVIELNSASEATLGDRRHQHAPEGDLMRRDEARRVHATLDLLPSHYARALEWKYLEHVSVNEIAKRLRLGPKAAESLLTRARQAFRAQYERLDRGRAEVADGRKVGS